MVSMKQLLLCSIFLFWTRMGQAQEWLRMDGNELIDLAAYQEIDITQPPYISEMPEHIDLSVFFPVPDSQGSQGSCSAWASAYAIMTYLQYGESTLSLSNQDHLFSPSFIYNHTDRQQCHDGMSLYEALTKLKDIGAVPLSQVPYNSLSCTPLTGTQNSEAITKAYSHRISEFTRIEMKPDTMRAFLAKGHPVLISLRSDKNFRKFTGMSPFDAPQVSSSELNTTTDQSAGYHAVVLVGYDIPNDTFRIFNSWGTDWGDQGYASMTTQTLLARLERAYIIQPFPKKAQSIILPKINSKPKISSALEDSPFQYTTQTRGKKKVQFHSKCDKIWIESSPTARINYQNKASHALHFSLQNTTNSYLVVKSPDGRWLCDGQSHAGQPWTVFPAAPDGEYTIWIGNKERNQQITATLIVDTNPPKPIQYIDEARNQTLYFAQDFDDGSHYVGEWLNYKFHGEGTYTFASGAKYAGEWEDGKRQGQGTFRYATGDQYSGEWKNELQDGHGTFVFAIGGQYTGEWKDGKKNGLGTYSYQSGAQYLGEWKDGKENGNGTFTHASGDQYVGEWVDGSKAGYGTFTFYSGDQYSGEWANDKENGQGTYYYLHGDRYSGEWINGTRHGYGTYLFVSGNRYEGEWENNERNGKGIFYFTNGDTFEGEWKNGERNGKGIFYSVQTGEYTSGVWINDQKTQ
jgi:hypothetical protein